MPGGKVVFFEGILPKTQTEAGMAVVMGHEIAHAVAKHSNERLSQQMVASFEWTPTCFWPVDRLQPARLSTFCTDLVLR